MQAISDLNVVSGPAMTKGRLNVVTTPDDQLRPHIDFGFLRSNSARPFAVRLAFELAEAVRAIRQDPVAFIGAISESGTITPENRSRIRAGIIVAVAFYALLLSGIYASYAMFHLVQPTPGPVKHLEITYLAPPPMPVKKAGQLIKNTASGASKDQLTVPTRPAEQPKTNPIEANPTPRPPDQTLTRTEPATQPSNSPTSESASRDSASDGAARGQQGNGVGTASGGGRGGIPNEGVNYNDVFSVSNVSTRPQILARPVPGYTEEARRAQVEGAVKLSVVLNANGTVSEITVARALGYGLDQKAVEAARELRFIPAQKDGHTVSVRVFLEFKFSLL